jgi:hypothetical protein
MRRLDVRGRLDRLLALANFDDLARVSLPDLFLQRSTYVRKLVAHPSSSCVAVDVRV